MKRAVDIEVRHRCATLQSRARRASHTFYVTLPPSQPCNHFLSNFEILIIFTMASSSSSSSSSSEHSESSGEDDDKSSSSSDSNSEEEMEIEDTNETTVETHQEESRTTTYLQESSAPSSASTAVVHRTNLSKSWSIQSSHVPIYTGGKLTLSSTTSKDEDDETSPFILLPVSGNLALVDAARGRRLATVRPDNDGQDDDDDDEDDGIDRDAITSYCLSHKTSDLLVTCSQNLILRQYAIQKDDTNNNDQQQQPCMTLELVKTWGRSGHTLPVTQMAMHTSNTFVATGSVDGTVRIWDVRGGFCTHVFRPVAGGETSGSMAVTALQWMPSHRDLVIAIGRDDGSIVIQNLRDTENKQVAVLRDHVSAVTCLEWEDNLLITSGRDAVLNLWRMKHVVVTAKNLTALPKTTYERVHTLPIYEQVEGLVLVKYQDSLVAVTAGSKGVVRMWKVVNDEKRQAFELMGEQLPSEAFGSERGGYMELRTCVLGGLEQLVVADTENNVSFLSLEASSLLKTIRNIVGHNDDILDLKVIPSSTTQRIVVATNSSKVSIFDLKDFSCQVLDRHTATVLCVDVSPCGNYVVTCGKDKQTRLWNIQNNSCVGLAVGHTEAVGAAALSKKAVNYKVTGKAAMNGGGSFIATASMDRTLKRWNLPGLQVLDKHGAGDDAIELQAFHSVFAHDKDINIVSVAPNDSLIATGSQDKTVKLWKASDLSLQATLKGHKRGVWDCQFSSYDRVLATASGDRTIKLWSLSDKYSCVRTFQGHLASVLRVRFLSGGLQLISAGADGLIKLWTIRTNQCETTLDGHSNKVWAMDLSPNENDLVSGGADSKLVVWEDTTKETEEAVKAEAAEAVLLDQKLANHLRHKEYSKAFAIALQRDKPLHVLKVLTAVIDEEVEKGGSGLLALQKEAIKWSDERILQMLRYCRDWNTRARNSNIAMLVCKAVVSVFSVDKLVGIHGLPEVMAGIIPYAERHFDRLDRQYNGTFLLDFVLASMGGIEPVNDLEEEFADWEQKSRLVLPPKSIDGRTQVGGTIVNAGHTLASAGLVEPIDDEDVMTVGDSDSSDGE